MSDFNQCEAHEVISTPHCPICLLDERDRLQSELTSARDEAEKLRGRCGELEADANRFKFIARRESHQSMAMVNYEIACISGENPTEDQFREAVDEAMESAQRMSPQGAAPDIGGEK